MFFAYGSNLVVIEHNKLRSIVPLISTLLRWLLRRWLLLLLLLLFSTRLLLLSAGTAVRQAVHGVGRRPRAATGTAQRQC